MGWMFSLALFVMWCGKQAEYGLLLGAGLFAIAGAIAFNCGKK